MSSDRVGPSCLPHRRVDSRGVDRHPIKDDHRRHSIEGEFHPIQHAVIRIGIRIDGPHRSVFDDVPLRCIEFGSHAIEMPGAGQEAILRFDSRRIVAGSVLTRGDRPILGQQAFQITRPGHDTARTRDLLSNRDTGIVRLRHKIDRVSLGRDRDAFVPVHSIVEMESLNQDGTGYQSHSEEANEKRRAA